MHAQFWLVYFTVYVTIPLITQVGSWEYLQSLLASHVNNVASGANISETFHVDIA